MGDAPEGWRLVPVEPTKEMTLAANRALDGSQSGYVVDLAYKAMLAAAPSLPQPDGWRPIDHTRIRKDLIALKASIEGIDVEDSSPLDVAHTLYNLANDAQVILNLLPPVSSSTGENGDG